MSAKRVTLKNKRVPPLLLPAALVGLQIAKTLYWFRHIDLSQPYPIINFDYVLYYARVLRAHEFLSSAGRMWGYDPYQMAGYVAGPFEVGTHFFSLLAHALSPLAPIHRSLLAIEFFSYLVLPVFIYGASRLFGGTKPQSWAAFGFAVACFGGVERLTGNLIQTGLFGYMVAGFISLWQAGCVWRFLSRPRASTYFLMMVASALLFQIHPVIVVAAGTSNLILYGLFFKTLPKRWHGFVFLGVLLVAAVNWYWIHPLFHFRHWLGFSPYLLSRGFQQIMEVFGPFQFTLRDWFVTLFNWLCVLLAARTLLMWKATHRRLFYFFLGWILCLFVFGFFGSQIPFLKGSQSSRILIVFWFVVWLAGSFSFIEAVWRNQSRRAGLAILLPCLALFYVPGYSILPRDALQNKFPAHIRDFISTLNKLPRTEGRILVGANDSTGTQELDLLPALTDRSYIGGPNPGVFIIGAHTLFSETYFTAKKFSADDPRLFGRPLKSYTEKELEMALDLYNIWLIAVRNPVSIEKLGAFPRLLEPSGAVGRYYFYKVKRVFDWFIKGTGNVRFDFDQIELDHAASGDLILKFHYIDTFQTNPPVPIEPIFIDDDPVPFIKIDNSAGHSRIRVFNAGL